MRDRSKAVEINILLRATNQNIVLRGASTDVLCFEKIFTSEEYRSPFTHDNCRFIVDAGANIGMAAIFFAHQFPEAQIIAIEPERSNFRLLKRNCAELPNIRPLHAALWPRAEQVSVLDPNDGAWACQTRHPPPRGATPIDQVQGITMCEILAQSPHGLIDLLKLDIEGAELDLFSERASAWLPLIDTIAIELHDRLRPGCSRALYSALLECCNFRQEIRGENVFIQLLDSSTRDTTTKLTSIDPQ